MSSESPIALKMLIDEGILRIEEVREWLFPVSLVEVDDPLTIETADQTKDKKVEEE
jgi:hypothetical protein